jgi:hypothetical protein
MGLVPLAPTRPIPPGRKPWSGRLKVNRGFQGLRCPRDRQQDLLSGFERPSSWGSLFELFVGTWSARAGAGL